MALTTGMNRFLLFSTFLNAETDFGLDMIRQSPANVQLVVSPLSVIFALTMIQAGAKGKTKTQINQVISKGASDNELTNFYSTLSQDIGKASNGVQTRIANAFFLDMKYRIEKQYADTITRKYGAKIDALNFAQTAQTAKTINAFISKTTAGKIDDLVTEDMVRGAFSLVVNAIYFTAKWEYEFDKSSTSHSTFYSSSNKQRKIEFLNEFGKNRMYAEDRDMQVLSLRYKDTSYALNVFLPKVRYGLDALRKKLTGATIQKLLSQLRSTYMTISLPKMKIETDFKLKKALMAMGVTEMFSDNADLSGITKLLPLKVSDAVHKAIIEVDEEGTTAAAATVIIAVGGSAITQEPIRFTADHPFIFVLTKNANPLFMGQFA